DCGCNTGGGDGTWNQKWRGPLRDGLNWLRDRLAETFQKTGGRYLADPWLARDKYITLVANGYAPEIQEKFLAAHCLAPLDRKDRLEVLSLLEAQLMSLYMFTSCGWFFDDISGLEPVQNLRYALRAIELSQGLTETNLREGFLGYLDLIRPNDPEYETGRDIWRRKVENGSLTGRALAAHWAAATLLDVPQLLDSFAEPTFQNRGVTILEGEDLNILAGVVDLVDRRLGRTTSHLCLALHSGGTHLAIMAGDLDAEAEIPAWLNRDALREALAHQPLTASASMIIWDRLVKLADMENASRHIMSDLLPHCRNMLLSTLLNDVFDDLKERAEDIFHTHQHLLMMNRLSGRPLDWEEDFIFRAVGEAELRYVMEPARFSRPLNLGALTYLLNKRGLLSLVKTTTSLEEIGRAFLDTTFRALATAESPRRLLTELIEFLRIIDREGFSLDRWESQNRWCDLTGDKDFQARLSPEEEKLMDELGLALGFAPPPTGGPAD
ncbi:MAG: DUF3536 domain-containing protein, partial [Candidatus Adiutrix sp.]|nr:DUF3536 domain-containing protein [Candidatus Adiutrix sp.]